MTSEERRKRGTLLHAKHAFVPNSLGYCGPDDRGSILEHLHDSTVTPSLVGKLRAFEAAYPFIQLIATCNGKDVFDYPVPEAYWIGNDLLDNVPAENFYTFEHSKMPNRDPEEVRRLFGRAGALARPLHTFHVVSTFATSIVADGPNLTNVATKKVEATVDNCRISWGEVKKVGRSTLVIERQPLKFDGGIFKLAKPVLTAVRFDRQIAPFGGVGPGDLVSTHWGFACEVLTSIQARNARKFTEADIKAVNLVLQSRGKR